MGFSRQENWSCYFLLQGIFLTQGLNPGLSLQGCTLGGVHYDYSCLECLLGHYLGFPCGSAGKESTCNVGHLGLIPGSGIPLREGNGNLLQYSCLGNIMNRGDCQAAVHRVTRVGHNFVAKPPTGDNKHVPLFLCGSSSYDSVIF